jgi:hypothetical protein
MRALRSAAGHIGTDGLVDLAPSSNNIEAVVPTRIGWGIDRDQEESSSPAGQDPTAAAKNLLESHIITWSRPVRFAHLRGPDNRNSDSKSLANPLLEPIELGSDSGPIT